MMKHKLAFGSLLLAVAAAVVVAPALAAERRRDLTVTERTFLQGTEIPSGDYSLKWQANGDPDEFTLTVQAGKKVLATAIGRRVTLEKPSVYDSLIYLPGEAGSRNLIEIRFAGKKEAIRVEPRVEASLR